MATRSNDYKLAIDVDNTLHFDGVSLDGWRVAVDSELRKGNVDAAIELCTSKLDEARASKGGDKPGEARAALAVAQASIWAGKTKQALDHVEEAQSLYNSLGGDLENATVKHTLARVHIKGQIWDDAFEAATDALALFKKAGGAKLSEAAVLNTLAICELMRGNADECLKRAEASLDMFRDSAEVRGQASAQHTKAILYSAAGEKAEGVRQAQECSSLLKDSGDDRRYVAALLATSESAFQSGDFCLASETSQEALVVLEKLDDKRGQASVLLSLGALYFKQDMHVKGIDVANAVISLAKEIGNKKFEAQAWFLSAQMKRAKVASGGLQWPPKQGLSVEELEDMQNSSQSAVDLFEEIGDDEGEAGSRFELCHAFLAKNELERGQKEIQLSQKKFRQIGDATGECIATIIGAQVEDAKGEKNLATGSMEKALGLAQEGATPNPFLERVAKQWIKQNEPAAPKVVQDKEKAAAAPDPHSEQGGISPAVYAQCIHRALMYGESTGEHFFDDPGQTIALEAILGIKFPFLRNHPPPGQEFDPLACVTAWGAPPSKPIVKLVAGGGKSATPASPGSPGGVDLNLKKPRLPPMAVPPPQPQTATARAQGSDILGGRLPEVPEDVHSDMVALASKGDIPVTKAEDRAVFITKKPTFYGDPLFRDALRFGYIHPTANQAPRGMKWKSVRAGAFKLVAAAA